MSRHRHAFRRFLLYDIGGPGNADAWNNTVRLYTRQTWRPGDYWYAGWQCPCGEPGFGIADEYERVLEAQWEERRA